MPGPIILVVVLLSFPIVVGLSTAVLAALIGPTVCELDGPIPILNRSRTLTAVCALLCVNIPDRFCLRVLVEGF